MEPEPKRQPKPAEPKRQRQLVEKSKAKPSSMTIPLYRVIYHNDDHTSFQFVEFTLCRFFNKTPEQAKHLAMEVHKEDAAVVGVYALEHAESRRDAVIALARANRFPLRLSIEPEI